MYLLALEGGGAEILDRLLGRGHHGHLGHVEARTAAGGANGGGLGSAESGSERRRL